MKAIDYQNKWASDFGNEYQRRNSISCNSRQKIWGLLLKKMNIGIGSALEIGCSRGHNLYAIKSNLPSIQVQGVEINELAIKERFIDTIVKASAYQLPFIENQFDLVFTAGVLIHLSDIGIAMQEIKRVSKKYILSIEYFTEIEREINYRDDVYCYAKNWQKLWEELGCKLIHHGEMKEFGDLGLDDDFAKSCHYFLIEK